MQSKTKNCDHFLHRDLRWDQFCMKWNPRKKTSKCLYLVNLMACNPQLSLWGLQVLRGLKSCLISGYFGEEKTQGTLYGFGCLKAVMGDKICWGGQDVREEKEAQQLGRILCSCFIKSSQVSVSRVIMLNIFWFLIRYCKETYSEHD